MELRNVQRTKEAQLQKALDLLNSAPLDYQERCLAEFLAWAYLREARKRKPPTPQPDPFRNPHYTTDALI